MISKKYDSPYEIDRTDIIKQLIRDIGKGTGKNALDIGCNKGFYSMYLLDCGYKTIGVDMDREVLEFAEKRCSQHGDAVFKLVDLEEYDFKNLGIKFDLVLCLELIEHINNRGELIRRIIDKMKTKGKIIISTPNMLSIEGFRGKLKEFLSGEKYDAWDPTHSKLFNSFEFSRFLKRNNKLKILKTTGYWYSSKKFPKVKICIGLPIKYTSTPLINMFGFNTIIVAEKI